MCHKPGVLGGPYKTRSPRRVMRTVGCLLGKSVDDPFNHSFDLGVLSVVRSGLMTPQDSPAEDVVERRWK